MRHLILSSAAVLLLGSAPADAAKRHKHRQTRPGVRVHVRAPLPSVRVGPWSVHYRPAARAGWRWVAGGRVHGAWSPGHWVPLAPSPVVGAVWVVGHWSGEVYVDGYWREPHLHGHQWVDGYYQDEGWTEGEWTEASPEEAPVEVVEAEPLPAEIHYEIPLDAPPDVPPDAPLVDEGSSPVIGEDGEIHHGLGL